MTQQCRGDLRWSIINPSLPHSLTLNWAFITQRSHTILMNCSKSWPWKSTFSVFYIYILCEVDSRSKNRSPKCHFLCVFWQLMDHVYSAVAFTDASSPSACPSNKRGHSCIKPNVKRKFNAEKKANKFMLAIVNHCTNYAHFFCWSHCSIPGVNNICSEGWFDEGLSAP